MLILQIRQAEVALADGRLDEAYQLIQSDRLRSHCRGQALVSQLVEALVQRGKAHQAAGRAERALRDCEMAQQLGGNLPDVVALRSDAERMIVDFDRDRRNRARVGAVQTATQLVDSALAREDLDQAAAELMRARANGCSDHRLRELDANVRNTLRQRIETAFSEGRLDQVSSMLARLERLDPEGLPTVQLASALDQAWTAREEIGRGRTDEAHEILSRLVAQLPDAKWIPEALRNLRAASESLRAMRTGPLGLLELTEGRRHSDGPRQMPGPFREADLPQASRRSYEPDDRTDESLPSKFIVQVDGAGSYLVVRQPKVTLGPLSCSKLPDVALIAEPGAAVVTIERLEDDYFLSLPTRKLLSSGDRIAVSPRCRLLFSLPSPSSTSAALDLTSGRFPRADLRRVILLDRELIVGPGAACHIRADHLSEPVVLHVRQGRLWCRSQPIPFGAPASFAGICLVLTRG